MQTNADLFEDELVPTKTDSRTSETQKRMYSPNGLVFKLIAKDAVTVALEDLRFRSSHPRAAWDLIGLFRTPELLSVELK
jgi:hypothetical protein